MVWEEAQLEALLHPSDEWIETAPSAELRAAFESLVSMRRGHAALADDEPEEPGPRPAGETASHEQRSGRDSAGGARGDVKEQEMWPLAAQMRRSTSNPVIPAAGRAGPSCGT
jgi:hypothetical protein